MTDKWENHEYVVEFDFLGKDSMRYHNEIGVPKVSVGSNIKTIFDDHNLASLQKCQTVYGK